MIQLEQIVVEGNSDDAGTTPGGIADPAPPVGYVPTETTAGSKTATDILAVPQSVSVVGEREIEDLGAQKIDEALRYTAGVYAQPFGPDGDTDWIYIRGFDASQTGIFLDSLQLFQYAFAGYVIDPWITERIEVLKGAASVLYGGSNAGGIVNIISKRADGKRRRYVEFGITDEPNGYGAFDLGDRFNADSPWSYRVLGKLKGGATQTEYADEFRGLINPNLTFDNGTTRAEFYGSFQYDDNQHTGGFWPYVGSVVDAPYGRIPRDLFYSEPEEDYIRAWQAAVGADVEHDVNENVTVRSNTRYTAIHREEYGPYPYDYDTTDNTLYRLNFKHDTDAQLFNSDNQIVLRGETTPLVQHELLLGVDYRYFHIDQVQATGPADPLDPINPIYTNALPALYDPYLDDVIDLHQLGFYAQDQARFGNGFILTANGRVDNVWIDRNDRSASNADYSGFESALSGRIGLGYEFDFGLVPYVSASHFFAPQIGTDANGDPVNSQTGEQYEVGFKYRPQLKPGVIDGLFTVSLFDLTRRNTLQSVAPLYIPQTVGEINSKGIELEATLRLWNQLDVKGAFTAYDLTIVDDANEAIIGNQPYLIPNVLASLWMNYTVPTGRFAGVEIGGGVRYQGESYADNENTLKVPDAFIFDARLAYERDNYGVSLNVTNLFDEEYVSGCQGIYTCGYGEGRKFLLKAFARF
ncbi:TonB-dependent siderophore receptor [Acuticoccus mangrovi]|uniref:TonB-dependent siderophore receptor n=1 Tax=Acuticoccus mangrovi TaxID=2796142 RepID=A0A934ILC7_9HYPH|nr:TonB-dependent siderophore receptor [Acuticoccus mangrovi]